MGISWQRVADIPFVEFGCGIQSVVCMGDGRVFSAMEEVGDDESPNHNPDENLLRRFRSTDYGVTWEELPVLYHDASMLHSFQGKAITLAADSLLLPLHRPSLNDNDYDAQAALIARSTDGGDTFASAVEEAVFNTISDTVNKRTHIQGFIRANNGIILAVGQEHSSTGQATTALYLTSSDGGVTFENPRYITVGGATQSILRSGVHLGGGIILVGCERAGAGGPAYLARSTDNGDTWAQVLMPDVGTGNGWVNDIGWAGENVAAVGARPPGSTPRAWYSTDDGATFSDANLASWSAAYINSIVALNATHFLAGGYVSIAQIAGGSKPFRLSTDGGLTYDDPGTYTTALTADVDYLVNQMAVLPNGNVVAVVQTIDGAEVGNEIWLGTVTDIETISDCEIEEEAEVGEPEEDELPTFEEVICPCMTDSAKIYDLAGVATTLFTGLLHLAGELVDVKADNVFIGEFTVSDTGTVEIPEPAYWRCEIGLHYDSTAITMRPAIDGTMVEGLPRKWIKKWLRLHESLGGKIDDVKIHYPPEGEFRPYTGDVDVYSEVGPSTDERITIVQDQPYCITILCIFGEVEFGDHG